MKLLHGLLKTWGEPCGIRLLWQSGGTGGAMTLFNTFRCAKSRPYGRPAILPVLANGGLKYPRSRGAWQIRLKHRQANGEITAPLSVCMFYYPKRNAARFLYITQR